MDTTSVYKKGWSVDETEKLSSQQHTENEVADRRKYQT